MKCTHCGFERDTEFAFCPSCGKPSTPKEEPVICPTPRILSLIKDNLFLAICILLTISVALAIFSGGFNIINILITVFAWITYEGGKNNTVKSEHIKVISGSVYANYIINNISAVFLAIGGILYTLAIFIGPLFGILSIEELFTEKIGPILALEYAVITMLAAVAMFFGLFLILMAIIILVINVGGIKKLHSFVKSTYKSVETGEENIADVKKLGLWLIIFAVASIISALSYISNSNVFGFLSNGCMSAVYIILNQLISKYFCDKA